MSTNKNKTVEPKFLSTKTSFQIWIKALIHPWPSTYSEFALIEVKPQQSFLWVGYSTGLIWLIGILESLCLKRNINYSNALLGILSIPFSIIGFMFVIALINVSARILGGRNKYKELAFSTSCFYTTSILVLFFLSMNSSMVFTILFFAFDLYFIYLSLLSIKGTYDFSWSRAIAVYFLSLFLLFLIAVFALLIAYPIFLSRLHL